MWDLFAERDAFDLISFVLGVVGFAIAIVPFVIRWRKRALAQDDALFEVTKRYEEYRGARKIEIDGLNKTIDEVRERLEEVDPERFIDKVEALYDAAEFDKVEDVALAFYEKQSEAFGKAAEYLTEQRLLDSESHGQGAIDEAVKFAAIGAAAFPHSKRLAELQKLVGRRADDIRKGDPIEALNFEGMDDVALNRLANALTKDGHYMLAEVAARRSVPLALTRTGEKSANYVAVLATHGNTLRDIGDFDLAEDVLKKATGLGRVVFGEGHPEHAVHLNNLAGVVEAQGRFTEAEGLFGQAIEIAVAALGEGHPHTQRFRANLERLRAEMG